MLTVGWLEQLCLVFAVSMFRGRSRVRGTGARRSHVWHRDWEVTRVAQGPGGHASAAQVLEFTSVGTRSVKSFLHKGQAPSCGEGGQVPTREARGACRSASLAASVRSLSPCDGPRWAAVTVVGALWPRAGSQQPCSARGRSWAHPLAGRSSCRRRRGPGLVSARLEVGGEHPGRVGAGGLGPAPRGGALLPVAVLQLASVVRTGLPWVCHALLPAAPSRPPRVL